MAGLAEDAERAVGQAQDHGPGVDIVVAREDRKAAHRAGGVDLVDLLAGHPAQRVEVVDGRVAEEPAGDRDVGVGRRLVVVGDEPDEVDGPELA